MIVLDTTVLVYAVGADHPLRAPCRAIVAAVGDGSLAATTTPEVIQELAHVRARRRDRDDAATLATSYAELLSPLLVVDEADLRAGLDLFRSHDRLGAFDCVLAAAARHRGANGLVSAGRAFADLDGLHHIDPADSEALSSLLDD